jgi:hypothetical protein
MPGPQYKPVCSASDGGGRRWPCFFPQNTGKKKSKKSQKTLDSAGKVWHNFIDIGISLDIVQCGASLEAASNYSFRGSVFAFSLSLFPLTTRIMGSVNKCSMNICPAGHWSPHLIFSGFIDRGNLSRPLVRA